MSIGGEHGGLLEMCENLFELDRKSVGNAPPRGRGNSRSVPLAVFLD